MQDDMERLARAVWFLEEYARAEIEAEREPSEAAAPLPDPPRKQPMSDDMVAVPRWALEFIMEQGDHCDRGPPGEGWYSDEMRAAVDALEKALSYRSITRARENAIK